MKIMQVIPKFSMGGAENMCETLCYELKNLGHEVVVVSLYSDKTVISSRLEKNGINIIYLEKKLGLDFKCINRLRKIVNTEKPDVIHNHLYSLKYVILANRHYKIPIIHTIHNVANKESSKINRIIAGYALRHHKVHFVALSSMVLETIYSVYKCPKIQIPIILNGVDSKKYIAKQNYKYENIFNYIHVGRFSSQKNHKRLIYAFKKIFDIHKEVRLTLIGDGELINEMKKLCIELGIEKYVSFLGIIDNVANYMSIADCFVLSSDYEGVPITIIEAMMSGLPIVSTNVGGIPDMLSHLDDSILVSPDVDSLFNGLNLVFEDEQLREKIGRTAYDKSKNFTSKKMAERYVDYYGSCVLDSKD